MYIDGSSLYKLYLVHNSLDPFGYSACPCHTSDPCTVYSEQEFEGFTVIVAAGLHEIPGSIGEDYDDPFDALASVLGVFRRLAGAGPKAVKRYLMLNGSIEGYLVTEIRIYATFSGNFICYCCEKKTCCTDSGRNNGSWVEKNSGDFDEIHVKVAHAIIEGGVHINAAESMSVAEQANLADAYQELRDEVSDYDRGRVVRKIHQEISSNYCEP